MGKGLRKVESTNFDETHVLVKAFCDKPAECNAIWNSGISPTQWAEEHTRDTGHATIVKHEKTWSEIITSVTDKED